MFPEYLFTFSRFCSQAEIMSIVDEFITVPEGAGVIVCGGSMDGSAEAHYLVRYRPKDVVDLNSFIGQAFMLVDVFGTTSFSFRPLQGPETMVVSGVAPSGVQPWA